MVVDEEYGNCKMSVPDTSWFVKVPQRGETADTRAALRKSKELGYMASLAICNVPESSLVRESELVMMTRAGPEISVASTKAFTTQLAAFGLEKMALARHHGMEEARERELTPQPLELPALIEKMHTLNEEIKQLSDKFIEKHNELLHGSRRPNRHVDGRRPEAKRHFLYSGRGLCGR